MNPSMHVTQPLKKPMAFSAVIPAAGFSSRMHTYKPLLKVGNKTMVETVIQLFQSCGIMDIIVVTGHNQNLLKPIVQKAGARPVFNPDFKTGMFGSIQKGVEQVSKKSKGFFLLPVDIPAIRTATILSIVTAFEKSYKKIIIPEFEQTTGHPPLIPGRLIPEILGLDSDSNLGKFLLSQKDRLVRYPVHDSGILIDADTKEAYDVLTEKYQRMDIPDKEECNSIIHSVLPGETDIQSHLILVANTALKLGQALEKSQNSNKNKAIYSHLNKNLIQAAALLHDIKRMEKNHAKAGSRLLANLGFEQVAGIVAEHMTLRPENLISEDLITEKEIVYFADKICNGTQVETDYAKRFADKIKQAPHAQTRISQRYEATQQIQARIEEATGRSISTILQ
jgi:molybdenum cofactor cytidylyltransferase